MLLNQTSDLKVRTIWISREPPLFNFKRIDILLAWIGHPSQKLWLFEFGLCFHVYLPCVSIFCSWIGHPMEILWLLKFLESFWCSIPSVSIYYWPESDIQVKSYARLNLPCVSIFNFEHLDIFCFWIGQPSEKLGLFKFLESLICSISCVSIYYWPESRYILLLNLTSEWNFMTIWISLLDRVASE